MAFNRGESIATGAFKMLSSKSVSTVVVSVGVLTVLRIAATALAQGPTYRLGTAASAEEIKARDTAISPDGRGLPPGTGTVKEGAIVYAQKCQACHGLNGTGTSLHRGLIPLGNSKPV